VSLSGDRSANLFSFQSHFWVNLHHRLFEEAGWPKPAGPTSAEGAGPESYSSDKPEWRAAVDFYRSHFAKRDPASFLSDGQLVAVTYRLAAREGSISLQGAELEPELTAQLEAAARVYRAGVWTADDQANARWVGALKPRLEKMGGGLARDLILLYGVAWPGEAIKVEVSTFAGPVGAYTLLTPALISVASLDSRNSEDLALEILLHEASHVLVPVLKKALEDQCKAQQKDAGDLWHALIFYTTGELVRRRLGSNYIPYAERNGLYAKAPRWEHFAQILSRDWKLYLDGDLDLEAAIAKTVADL
jgi:hypothetical protein